MKKYVINNGNIFKGTLEEFQKRWFNDANEQKIRDWCKEKNFNLDIECPDDIIVVFRGEYEDKMAIAVFTRSEFEKIEKKFPDEFKNKFPAYSDEYYSTEVFSLNSWGTDVKVPNKKKLRYMIYKVTMDWRGIMFQMSKLPLTVDNSVLANASAIKKSDNDLYNVYVWALSDGNAIEKAQKIIDRKMATEFSKFFKKRSQRVWIDD